MYITSSDVCARLSRSMQARRTFEWCDVQTKNHCITRISMHRSRYFRPSVGDNAGCSCLPPETVWPEIWWFTMPCVPPKMYHVRTRRMPTTTAVAFANLPPYPNSIHRLIVFLLTPPPPNRPNLPARDPPSLRLTLDMGSQGADVCQVRMS